MMSKLSSKEYFRKTWDQLQGLHEEIGTLSKRKPDDAVNIFKLRFINQILGEANQALDPEHLPLNGFTSFDEDTVPTNSDVVLILSQYLKCFDRQWQDERTIF